MNQTNFEHAAIALILQAIVGLLTGDWLAGALLCVGVFLGREHAQREYAIKKPGVALVGYEALDFWRWNIDEILDLVFPIVAVIAAYLIVRAL